MFNNKYNFYAINLHDQLPLNDVGHIQCKYFGKKYMSHDIENEVLEKAKIHIVHIDMGVFAKLWWYMLNQKVVYYR